MSEAEDLMKNGFSLIDKGKYLDGLRELSKLEPQFQSKSNEEAADLFLGISQAYYGMTPSNDENSLKYADLAIEIHKKLGITPMVISDLLYSSFIETDAGKLPEAEKRIEQAIELARSSKDTEELPELLNSKADLLSTIKKRRKESAALYIEASKTANDSGNPQAYFHSRTGLIKLKRLDGLDPEKALASEGIQKGHMKLHSRNIAISAGATPDEVGMLSAMLVESGDISPTNAKNLLEKLRKK